jgi:hypothetical protein
MIIKIKIKNKLEDNYEFFIQGEIKKKNLFNKNKKNKDQIVKENNIS